MNAVNKPLFFLSAADRINYGDLLFPILFKKVAESSGYTFYNYGVVASDLTSFDALPTRSYKALRKDLQKQPGKLVIGGGEVLFPDWPTLYAFINSRYAGLRRSKLFKKLENRLQIAQYLLGGRGIPLPFSPHAQALGVGKVSIYYNSVGGQFYGSLDSVVNRNAIEALQSATYISVRDQRTKDALEKAGLEAVLAPDSALIMSDFFPLKTLKTQSTIAPSVYETDYLFVQLGRFKGPRDLQAFSEMLQRISEKLNLKVILCPIGLAPGHEDDIILNELAALNPNFKIQNPKSVYDIMLLIAASRCYLGTSLHGLITAQSYEVPHLPFNKNIYKAEAYLKTWIDPALRAADFMDEPYILNTYTNWNHKKINTQTNSQKQKVRENLQLILKPE